MSRSLNLIEGIHNAHVRLSYLRKCPPSKSRDEASWKWRDKINEKLTLLNKVHGVRITHTHRIRSQVTLQVFNGCIMVPVNTN